MTMEDNDPVASVEVNYSHFTAENEYKRTTSTQRRPCDCCRRCCFKGYFWGVVGALYFFIILPAGILLMIHGHHRGVIITLCLGAIELTVFICVVPGVYLGLRHWHRRRLKRNRAERLSRNVLKEKAAFVNADPEAGGSPTSGP